MHFQVPNTQEDKLVIQYMMCRKSKKMAKCLPSSQDSDAEMLNKGPKLQAFREDKCEYFEQKEGCH